MNFLHQQVDKQYVRQLSYKPTRKPLVSTRPSHGDHHTPAFRPPQINQRHYPFDPSEDRYDKSLRTGGGSNTRYRNYLTTNYFPIMRIHIISFLFGCIQQMDVPSIITTTITSIITMEHDTKTHSIKIRVFMKWITGTTIIMTINIIISIKGCTSEST